VHACDERVDGQIGEHHAVGCGNYRLLRQTFVAVNERLTVHQCCVYLRDVGAVESYRVITMHEMPSAERSLNVFVHVTLNVQ
jgi:hypothetical protein